MEPLFSTVVNKFEGVRLNASANAREILEMHDAITRVQRANIDRQEGMITDAQFIDLVFMKGAPK